MNNFANSTPSLPQRKYIYKGGEEVKFISQFITDNHIIEEGVTVWVAGCQYSNFVDVRTNRNAKIRRVPVTSIARLTTDSTYESTTPYKPRNTENMRGPKLRSPEEECFWLNATEEAKQGKVLNLVNRVLAGDLYFTHYSDYKKWIKQARLVTGL